MSADTDLIRAFGSAAAGQVADLQAVAVRLSALSGPSTSMFGPVGARFGAALSRAADIEARRITELGASIAAARPAAHGAAQAYEGADADAGTRLTGTW
ncbi:MAG: ESX-1 secretion-associated protein [Mycobacterium sp.]